MERDCQEWKCIGSQEPQRTVAFDEEVEGQEKCGRGRMVGERIRFQRNKINLVACEPKFYLFRHVISLSLVNTTKITLVNTIKSS